MTVGDKYEYCNKTIIIGKALPIMLVTNILSKAKLLIKIQYFFFVNYACVHGVKGNKVLLQDIRTTETPLPSFI